MAAYTGLMTGAGAASGLETLLARMRAEEELAQRQQSLDQTGQYQQGMLGMRRRDLDLEEAGLPSLVAQRGASARASAANAGVDEAKLGLLSGMNPADPKLNVAGSPERWRLRMGGITPEPINEHAVPEWRARLEGFGSYTPEQVREAQSSPYADRYYQLATTREERLQRDQQFRQQIAKERFDFAVGEAAKKIPDATRLSAFRMGLAKRLSDEVSKPMLGIFGASVEDQIDAIVSEEMAKLENPTAPTDQNAMPQAIPQGVVVRPRAR